MNAYSKESAEAVERKMAKLTNRNEIEREIVRCVDCVHNNTTRIDWLNTMVAAAENMSLGSEWPVSLKLTATKCRKEDEKLKQSMVRDAFTPMLNVSTDVLARAGLAATIGCIMTESNSGKKGIEQENGWHIATGIPEVFAYIP